MHVKGHTHVCTCTRQKKKIYPNICLFYILINEIFISYIYWNSSHWSDSFSYHKTSYIVIYRGEPSWFHSRVTCSHNQLVSSHWPRSIDSSSSTWLLDLHMHVKRHTPHVYTCIRQKKWINPNICLFYILINEIFICPAWRQMAS